MARLQQPLRLAWLLRTTGQSAALLALSHQKPASSRQLWWRAGRKDFRQGTEESPLMAGGIAFCNGTNRRNKEVPLASVGARHSPTFSLTPKRRRRRQLKRAWSHHVDTMLIEVFQVFLKGRLKMAPPTSSQGERTGEVSASRTSRIGTDG